MHRPSIVVFRGTVHTSCTLTRIVLKDEADEIDTFVIGTIGGVSDDHEIKQLRSRQKMRVE